MKIKKIIASLFLLNIVLFSGIANGQQNEQVKKTPEEFALKRAERMKENLSLSEEQYNKVYNLFVTKANERKANKERFKSMDKTSRKELKKQNREKFNLQIKEILNQGQFEKWNKIKSVHKGKKRKGHHKHKKDQGNDQKKNDDKSRMGLDKD